MYIKHMDEKENNEKSAACSKDQAINQTVEKNAQNLADDPILNASSINSEDYWFLKLSGNDK